LFAVPRPTPLSRSTPGGGVYRGNLDYMSLAREIEFIFEPEPGGGYHAYAPELPGLHTEGDDLDEAVANAQEALALYIEGLREEGRPLDMGVVRRRLRLPA